MNSEFFEKFSTLTEGLKQREESFVLATVICVYGPAVVKVGSKIIFDADGKNIFGWIGGGYAERFVGEQAVESLYEKRARVVMVDLDNEVFGLRSAWSSKIEIFIEPIFSMEKVELPETLNLKNTAEDLANTYGLKIKWRSSEKKISSVAELFVELAGVLARQRERTGESMRNVKDKPIICGKMDLTYFKKAISIIGSGRIVESLAMHFSLLNWTVRSIEIDELDSVDIEPGECLLIVGQIDRNCEVIKDFLEQKPAYVGIIGGYKSASEIIEYLQLTFTELEKIPLFIPAGVDLDACNPNEIALGVAVEILKEIRKIQ